MLTKKTKYGIKALTFLAKQETKTPVQIATISLKFFESIILTLRKNGFLGSKQIFRNTTLSDLINKQS